jgi:hypothetical protein
LPGVLKQIKAVELAVAPYINCSQLTDDGSRTVNGEP